MADTKITALATITGANLASTDLATVVDVSDTSMFASGTNKAMTIAELLAGLTTVSGEHVTTAVATSTTGTWPSRPTADLVFWVAGTDTAAASPVGATGDDIVILAEDADLTTIAAANNGAVLAATTASFLIADESKLDAIAAGAEVNTVDSVNTATGAVVLDADDISDAATTNKFTTAADITRLSAVEAAADVTDTANVTAAGALMDSEVDADIKTLTLPASTTISTYGASLVDDADAATARATLDVDQAGTDNSTAVTLGGTPDYITISGQVITRNQIDLTADVTGVLPVANRRPTSATITGTSDTLAAGDEGVTNLYTNAAAVTVTLANLTVGHETVLVALGAGGLSVAAGGMSFANSFTPNLTIAQGEALFVKQTAASTWIVVGGTA